MDKFIMVTPKKTDNLSEGRAGQPKALEDVEMSVPSEVNKRSENAKKKSVGYPAHIAKRLSRVDKLLAIARAVHQKQKNPDDYKNEVVNLDSI